MDHIPEVSDPIYPPLQIPYLVDYGRGYRYHYLGFPGYPERCGWSTQELCRPNSARDRQDQLAFLQLWLFFGLLADVLNLGPEDLQHGLESEFSTNSSTGSRILSTERLSFHIERQSYIFGALDSSGYLVYYFRQRHSYLERTNSFLRRPRTAPAGEHGDLPDLIEFSVAILGEFLSMYLASACERRRGTSLMGYNPFHQIGWWGRSDLIKHRFEEQNWCPHDTDLVMGSPSVGYYASRLRYPNPGSHNYCIDNQCKASKVSSSYATTHKNSCSQGTCGLVYVDIAKVKSIIDDGINPVLKVSRDDDLPSGPQIFVETAAKHGGYVAISHVWSHGLGNPTDNALFHCQLMQLQRLAGNRYFWLDTLCIPVHSEDNSYRNKAISRMKGVYSAAEEVLVIDRCLQATSTELPKLELLLRVEISDWMKRLGTLQEAVLAQRLSIQFRDCALPLTELTRARIAGSWEISNPVSGMIGLRCAAFSEIGNATGVGKLCFISGLVRSRSTTKEEDEPLCLGTLLGIDIEPILQEEGVRKMLQFWSACDHSEKRFCRFTGQA